MSKNKQKSGFSLIEVVIAITTLVVVVVAATTLVVSSIRTTTLNIDNIVAYNLAQEGLEAVRNMRDSNYLSNQDWRKGGNIFWGSDFDQKEGEYTIEYKNIGRIMGMENQTINAVYLRQYAPWILKPIGKDEEAKLYLIEDLSLGVKRYSHDSTLGGTESKFSRKIIIKEVEEEGKPEGSPKIRVESLVFWNDKGKDKEQKLYMDLTNWQYGS
jgi:hypothetical protein